jgi:hypothetical protein
LWYASSDFFCLSQAMIRVGREEDFHRLLSDEQPIVRCAGLLGLAQMQGRRAMPAIRSYLYDTGKIDYQREGDIWIINAPVGYFAWNLLLNANHLVRPGLPAPLLTDSERIGLEIEFFAADSLMVGVLHYAPEHLGPIVRDGTLPLQMATLRAYAPTLEDYRIIKGLGRLKPSGKQRDFLVACLRDSTLDANARLAAGSALTRHADDVSSDALRRECNALNALDERRWGDQFVKTMDARKVHERNMEPLTVERAWDHEKLIRILPLLKRADEEDNGPLLAKRTWQRLEEVKDRVIVACTCRHPLALSNLLEIRNTLIHHDVDIHRAWVNSLIEISRNLQDYDQPWSTYADSASLLAAHVAGERRTEFPGRRHLTDTECDEIEKNIAETCGGEPRPAGEKLSALVTAGDGGL